MRIAAEPSLTVRLTIGETPPRADVRAMTRITQSAKAHRTAVVEIGAFRDAEELIAHEFEHIIEHLDGIDLAARAALPHTGVTEIGPGADVFETVRAKRAGLKVVSELRR